MSLLAITTNGKIGLGLVALVFIAFALVSSFVLAATEPQLPGPGPRRVPRRRDPDLPRHDRCRRRLRQGERGRGRRGRGDGDHSGDAEPTGTGTEPTETEPTETRDGAGETETGETETGETAGDAAAGEAVFASAGCGGCHTLEAAGSSGNVGPNLDESQPDAELVEQRVRNGAGAMPAFEGQLDDEEIANITAYVVASTSG